MCHIYVTAWLFINSLPPLPLSIYTYKWSVSTYGQELRESITEASKLAYVPMVPMALKDVSFKITYIFTGTQSTRVRVKVDTL